MDPDIVRQQAEAEREALALPRNKPARAFTPRVLPADPADTAQDARPPARATEALDSAAALKVPLARPEEKPLAPQAKPATGRKGFSAAAQVARVISFGVAGAIFGGGFGILAENYLHLPADLMQLAILGPAAFFAAVCSMAAFFTKPSHK